MPLYEGIGLIGEKEVHPVVLDIGSAYTKCGFGGEHGPRAIIPSRVGQHGRQRPVFSYTDAEDLYQLLVQLLQTVFFRKLLVNSKDRPVVVVESLLTPTVFRNVLANVLFRHFEASCCLVVPSHLVALTPLGLRTALVLDIGHREAVCIPVVEGVPVLAAWQALPLGSQAVQTAIRHSLAEHGRVTDLSQNRTVQQVVEDLTDDVIEDLQVRTTFVCPMERVASGASPPEFDYPLAGGVTLHVAGRTRHEPAEELFTPDADNLSLVTMLLDALLKCSVDARRALAANLLVVGGAAQLPGLRARLLAELRRQAALPPYSGALEPPQFALHRPPAQHNYAAWLGGAMFGGTDVVVTRSLSREKFLETGSLPDWCTITTPGGETRNL